MYNSVRNQKRIKNILIFTRVNIYHILRFVSRQGKDSACGSPEAAARKSLSLAEGLTVGALVLGGVSFMGAHQNPVQRAVVLTVAMVCAGLNSTLDTLVCIVIHYEILL